MKKYVAPLALLGALSLGSCSEDFELAAPYKNVTVVYGMLNPADTAHYIRIQKAFLDESKSAIDMAKEADSNFYRNLRVDIRVLNGNAVASTISNISRVDMTAEGYPKPSGSFFNTPNYAYKFKATLNPANRYRVVITNVETGNVDSAETNIISNGATDFQVAQFPAPPNPNYILSFTNTKPGQNFNIDITKMPAAAQVIEGVMHFRYVDKNTVTGVQTDHVLEWRFAEKEKENPAATNDFLRVPTLSFYAFLQGAIPLPPANTERYLDSADMYIWAANAEYLNYRRATLAAGGITGDQVKPIYTNIKGKDVLGLFAARTYVFNTDMPFNSATLDTIKLRPETSALKFVGFSDH